MLIAATSSPAGFIPFLLLAAVFGFAAYRSSEGYKNKRGYTPWHIPSWSWGVIGFLSLLIWAILFLIARSTTKPRIGIENAVSQAEQGWYPDPQLQGQSRYWDGSTWTNRVERAGVESVESV